MLVRAVTGHVDNGNVGKHLARSSGNGPAIDYAFKPYVRDYPRNGWFVPFQCVESIFARNNMVNRKTGFFQGVFQCQGNEDFVLGKEDEKRGFHDGAPQDLSESRWETVSQRGQAKNASDDRRLPWFGSIN